MFLMKKTLAQRQAEMLEVKTKDWNACLHAPKFSADDYTGFVTCVRCGDMVPVGVYLEQMYKGGNW